jgi:hypothetical protein
VNGRAPVVRQGRIGRWRKDGRVTKLTAVALVCGSSASGRVGHRAQGLRWRSRQLCLCCTWGSRAWGLPRRREEITVAASLMRWGSQVRRLPDRHHSCCHLRGSTAGMDGRPACAPRPSAWPRSDATATTIISTRAISPVAAGAGERCERRRLGRGVSCGGWTLCIG